MIAPVTAIKPYPLTARRQVPRSITRPHYVGRPAPDPYRGSHVQSPEVIEKMRVAGRIAAQAMHVAAEAIALVTERRAHPQLAPRAITCPHHLYIGRSCGCRPRKEKQDV